VLVEYNAGKNDAWDFEKWNAHACGHFIFPNVALVFWEGFALFM
jgi:hypothetical protein